MPELHFRVRWPDASQSHCYSPSSTVREYFRVGEAYALPEFLSRSRRALTRASERVRERYGYACSSATQQLAQIEQRGAAFASTPGATVTVLGFDDDCVEAAESAPHVPVIVVGGGQSGLSISYCLKQLGIEHRVFEQHRVGHDWRARRWDSFCLVTPNWQCKLPGFPYAGDDPHGFIPRAEIVEYLENYAASFDAPVSEGVTVTRLVPLPSGGFTVTTTQGEFTADQVVIATGGYQIPLTPPTAQKLPAEIVQVHSADYKNAQALPAGAVLVVGTGQSGCQIAEDLHREGRVVHLSVGSAPRSPRKYRGRDAIDWLDATGYYAIPIDEHPKKERVRAQANHYLSGRDGGHEIDLRRFALEGMRLHGRLCDIDSAQLFFHDDLAYNLDHADEVAAGIKTMIDAYIKRAGVEAPTEPAYAAPWAPSASRPQSIDLVSEGITSVVWATGYRCDFGWIQAPVFDARGEPRSRRGVTDQPGLYFLGLPWLHTWGSGRFSAVGDDARHLAGCIARQFGIASPHAAIAAPIA